MGLTALKMGQASSARAALGSRLAEAARAMSTSSLCSLGLFDPRYWTLTVWMGWMADWAIRCTPWPPKPGQGLQSVEQGGGGAAHQLGGLAG